METRYLKLIVFISVVLLLSSCETADLRSPFISYGQINERFEQSLEWNSVHPFREINVTSDNYTIFTMSDSHVGETVNLNTFINAAESEGAVAMVMVGDITTGNKDDFLDFKNNLPTTEIVPYFPLVGNHDLYFNGWEHYYQLFGSSSYLFTVKTPTAIDLYICLDTGSGTLGSEQLEWLEDILKNDRENYRSCVIFTHLNLFRPRFTASTNPLVEELHVLLDLFLRYKVNMVVTGHDHVRDTATFGNTEHIIMDALVDYNEDASYLRLVIKNGNLKYHFVDL